MFYLFFLPTVANLLPFCLMENQQCEADLTLTQILNRSLLILLQLDETCLWQKVLLLAQIEDWKPTVEAELSSYFTVDIDDSLKPSPAVSKGPRAHIGRSGAKDVLLLGSILDRDFFACTDILHRKATVQGRFIVKFMILYSCIWKRIFLTWCKTSCLIYFNLLIATDITVWWKGRVFRQVLSLVLVKGLINFRLFHLHIRT